MKVTKMNVSSEWRKTYRRALTVTACAKTRQRGILKLRGRKIWSIDL